MINLDSLDQHFKKSGPTDLEFIYYIFFTHGISFTEFQELPIPYIMSIIDTHNYVKEQEKKEMKKSKRK